MISFHRDTVTRLRATAGTNRYGDVVTDWATPDQRDITGCRVTPALGTEMVVDRDQVIRRWVLSAPYGADVLATDRIRWQGNDYEIDGEVRRWPSPTGAMAHIEADLLLVQG